MGGQEFYFTLKTAVPQGGRGIPMHGWGGSCVSAGGGRFLRLIFPLPRKALKATLFRVRCCGGGSNPLPKRSRPPLPPPPHRRPGPAHPPDGAQSRRRSGPHRGAPPAEGRCLAPALPTPLKCSLLGRVHTCAMFQPNPPPDKLSSSKNCHPPSSTLNVAPTLVWLGIFWLILSRILFASSWTKNCCSDTQQNTYIE